MKTATQIKNLIFDLDDTLIPSGHTYHVPRLDCAKIICLDLGILAPHPEDMLIDEDEIRKKLMREPGPISNVVQAQAWILYYQELCEKVGQTPRSAIISALGVTANQWLQREYQMFDGLAEIIEELPHNKVVATLGNTDIQDFKIASAGVDKLFSTIYVLDNKRPEDYQKILAKQGWEAKETCMIGDNPKLDILPALSIGMSAIYVKGFHRQDFAQSISLSDLQIMHPYDLGSRAEELLDNILSRLHTAQTTHEIIKYL